MTNMMCCAVATPLQARAESASQALSDVCRGISAGSSQPILSGVQQCPTERAAALSTALAQVSSTQEARSNT